MKKTKIKDVNYGKNVCVAYEGGIVIYTPESIKDVVGAENMTYDEYLIVQRKSFGKIRRYFECCYFNHPIEFKGKITKIAKDNICFNKIFVIGMFSDGQMFDGKEQHVWMNNAGFEKYNIGDCVSFFAEVYRYVKTGNGKHIDYSLRNPKNIKQIEEYQLPTDDYLILQGIDSIICESCMLYDSCNKNICLMNPKEKQLLKSQMFNIVKKMKDK